MITDEELEAIVGNYCRQIKRICDEIVYTDTKGVIEKAAEINKIAVRIDEIKSMQKAQKTAGEKNGQVVNKQA